jgi:hypothetical protein
MLCKIDIVPLQAQQFSLAQTARNRKNLERCVITYDGGKTASCRKAAPQPTVPRRTGREAATRPDGKNDTGNRAIRWLSDTFERPR